MILLELSCIVALTQIMPSDPSERSNWGAGRKSVYSSANAVAYLLSHLKGQGEL
jgi:hypothetical protein